MRVVTYNIKDGGSERAQFIYKVLSTVQADLILLQEVTEPALIRDWATQLKMECIVAKGHSRRYVALLSRYPIRSSESYTPVPGLSRDFLSATVEYGPNQTLRVFVVHLAAQPFIVFEGVRLLEIRAILRQARQDSSLPCLIGGDFNAVSPADLPIRKSMPLKNKLMLLAQANRYPRAVIASILAAQFTDCYRLLHTEPGYTLPPPAPTIRFDYLFANPRLKPFLQSCSVVNKLSAVESASDHYPLMADFAL